MTRCREWGKVGSWKNDHDVQPGRSMGIVQRVFDNVLGVQGGKKVPG